jgi:hypothetical protein
MRYHSKKQGFANAAMLAKFAMRLGSRYGLAFAETEALPSLEGIFICETQFELIATGPLRDQIGPHRDSMAPDAHTDG